ncbi:hypothetical protein DFJ58DRAFT_715176 [Suillus subalutaceus]|uniref:uncharacterized protein n=1 Tax=Suillus subalutaceus TaxID=48586 RepID=UPI001B85F351|nr:uncharacterized protein DFJ58DRAFT_715176 [Suillus subalutaceus]KAG1863245.1 hypothetical protein DFJ58DRAFT_715176 [Suillus subalutaceus]
MHNLFLGLVQHHFRDLITIDKQASKTIRAIRKPDKRPLDPEELDRGRTLLKSNPTISAMTHLWVSVLEALIQEAGIILLGSGKHSMKTKMAEALLVHLNDKDRMQVDDKTFIMEELVKQCAAEVEGKNNQKGISGEVLTDVEIDQIQAELHSIKRPSWHREPLKNLGEAEHGKIKAEQWRSAIEFDLPVILAKLWGMDHMKPGDENRKRRQKLAHSTMLLAMAIQWGTSHVTSTHHTQQYLIYMKAYLECIRDIFPSHSFRPNHHSCLHLHEFLLRYGPMHGWWMFPFERIIGGLQKTNMNYKIGELERTMLETFCTAAHIKAMLQEPGAPDVLNKAAEILQQCCAPFTEGAFLQLFTGG